jgi:TolB protein
MGIGVLIAALGYWWWASAAVVRDGAPAWSPDGKRVVFAAEQEGQSDLFVMNADGTGREQLTRSPAEESAPAFSPDGRSIAFERTANGNVDVYVMDASGRNERRLTDDPAADRSPAWSPDGRSIAFTSERDVRRQPDVYVMHPDGTGIERLTTTRTNWSPQFSPDGQRLAIQVERDIYVLNLATHELRRVTYAPDNGMSPTWSPDGQRIAFVTDRRGRLELFASTVDGAHQELLASMAGGAVLDPRWSPDGSRIVFVYVPDRSPSAGKNDVQEYALYSIELGSKKITRLSP